MEGGDQPRKPRTRRRSAKAVRPSKLLEQSRLAFLESLRQSELEVHQGELEDRENEWQTGLQQERDLADRVMNELVRMGGRQDFLSTIFVGVVIGGLAGAVLGFGPLADPRASGAIAGGIVAAVVGPLYDHVWKDRIRDQLGGLRSWWEERGSRPGDHWDI